MLKNLGTKVDFVELVNDSELFYFMERIWQGILIEDVTSIEAKYYNIGGNNITLNMKFGWQILLISI